MRTAVDTNIISALWSREPRASEVATNLGEAKSGGGLVIAAPVYAELLAYPKVTVSFIEEFIARTGLILER